MIGSMKHRSGRGGEPTLTRDITSVQCELDRYSVHDAVLPWFPDRTLHEHTCLSSVHRVEVLSSQRRVLL
jgi:hypothetical protein